MKNITYLLIIFIFSSLLIKAQPGSGKHRKEMEKEKLEFIKKQLQLTDKEEESFLPVYKEFSSERENFHLERRKIMRKYKKNSLNLSDDEMLQMADKLVEIDKEESNLNQKYHQKFKTILPSRKVFLLYKAEHEFRVHMLRKLRHKDDGPPPMD